MGTVQDTEDLVSDTFLKAVENVSRFDYRGMGSFAAWLFRIAHNVVSDFRRQRGRRQEPLSLETVPDIQDSRLSPDNAVVRKEDFAHLRRLIDTLSPRRQEVILLKFFGGLRNREIGQILRLDERAVASHLCRGIEDLHRIYADSPDRITDGGTYEHAAPVE